MVDILLRDTDSMSMAHSLEIRVPFLDHELVEFMFSVPGNFKVNRELSKPLLINSVKAELPREIAQRKKMGFVFPFDRWMRTGLKDELGKTLLTNDAFSDSLIDSSMTENLWRGFLREKISWQRIWAVFVLKKWMQNYLK
jgi:asparagine synthase (glutamine-hydrolysing)